MTNKWLGRLATKVCIGFPQIAAHFPAHKAVWTGNPVRWKTGTGQVTTPSASSSRKPFTVLIFGGSAGAHRLNQTLPRALALLGKGADTLRIVHQTGKADRDEVRAAYTGFGLEAEVVPFIETMREHYLAADLVICRAGAITLAELTSLGRPAILIPYPYAVDDHQRANAKILVRAGAARMVLDADLTPERMAEEIHYLMTDRATLTAMSQAALTLGRPEATAAVIRECFACLPPHVRPMQEAVCQ
jgi:UDP-N-acetylglucosamine--N-acetylmuramyl-(pentapeptide) pyrophosphoryl-undecaprenol N-acetylglucosamine transferase